MNPYFDRYDPTRDPRNMIREVRSVVYEEKEADRGLTESRRLSERVYLHRWLPEGSSSDDMKASLDAYEVMRPKQDNIPLLKLESRLLKYLVKYLKTTEVQ